MRIVKFRAWNKLLKEMGSPKTFEEWCIFKAEEGQFNPEFHYKSGEFANLILMQYTGFKDENHREIYRGDILDISRYACTHRIGVVKWLFDGWAIDIPEIGTIAFSSLTLSKRFGKIIGNIYDNPKLLREGSE